MITIPPSLLAHPAELRALASELLNLRFDRARLTEALLAMQQASAAERGSEATGLADRNWQVVVHHAGTAAR